MTENTPPRWADKFLRWYCNPELLEEIQGDAHELYHFRVATEGRSRADRKYIFDVIRFFRWSNIKRSENTFTSNSFAIFWNLNFKIAFRNAVSHKVRLATKVFSLAICLVFGLILSAFILQEFSYFQNRITSHP
jgi:putative ABC transport system permease protein